MWMSNTTAALYRNIRSTKYDRPVNIWTWSSAAVGRNAARGSVAKPSTGTPVVPPKLLVVDAGNGSHSDLSMPLRPDSPSHFAFVDAIATVRVSFPRNPWRTAGQSIQTPRLPARERDGRHRSRTKLDHLFTPEAAGRGTEQESKMFTGLRSSRP